VVVQEQVELGVEVDVVRLVAGRHDLVAPVDELGQHRARHGEQRAAGR